MALRRNSLVGVAICVPAIYQRYWRLDETYIYYLMAQDFNFFPI